MNFRRHTDRLLGHSLKAHGRPCQQAAAVCCRLSPQGELELLLVTSRDTGRWILPKGNIERKEAPYVAAQREAFEESGVQGKVRKRPIGFYSYLKDGDRELQVSVHLLRVTKDSAKFKETRQRQKAWFRPSVAAPLVDEPQLRQLLSSLNALELLASQDKRLSKKLSVKYPSVIAAPVASGL
ncbi:NUDIX hydrolase [Agrobacterium sp. Azo12]|uniref:NUDIX hydrolase n=1 Tax=Agrobacterium sp. Azo12 TaxID=3031129 RepID=UPI0034A0C5EB